MAVWLSMDMSYVGAGDTANRAKVAVSVTVHWSSVSYNGYSPPVTVSIDGASDTEYVSFNTGKTSSGSQTIYSKYWDLGYDSSGSARTAYGSASYDTGTASGTVSASSSVSLPAIDTGGGDSGDDDDDTYYQIIVSGNASVSVTSYGDGDYPNYKAGTRLKISVSPSTGYTMTSCRIDGVETTYVDTYINSNIYIDVETEPEQYALSISAGTGTTVTVYRSSSSFATTGNLSNGATIYYRDVLKVTFGVQNGYMLTKHTVNGNDFTSGNTHTVTGAVSIIAEASLSGGTLNMDDGTNLGKYQIHIEDGTAFYTYQACIEDGTAWYTYS